MTPAEFRAWRNRLGWGKAEAADHLGMGRNTAARYEAGENAIPRYVALACAALAHGIPPIGVSER